MGNVAVRLVHGTNLSDAGQKSASGKPNRGSVDVAGTLVLVSTDALWRQSQKPSQVVALQPDDRESDRGDVRPQQPRRGLSHHVSLVIVPSVGEHCNLLDERLSPRTYKPKPPALKDL